MEKNQIKISSNPYKKEIRYEWYEGDGRWSDMGKMNEAHFNSERFTSQAITNIAYDMLEEIRELGSSTGGIKVIFDGTDDDFSDLNAVRERYYPEHDIELVRGSRKMKSAKEVMPQINTSFTNLYTYFEEYPDEDTKKIISKYSDAVKPEIAVCVMGLYSTGKSAFINSIIGQEIMPSASDPTTAKIYKIRKSEKYEILFDVGAKSCTAEFDDSGWKLDKDPAGPISRLIKETINRNNAQSAAQRMYCALDALNQFAKEKDGKSNEKEQLGNVVEVHTQFVHSYLPLDKFEFVIYDTPGSGSATFQEHMDILSESLQQQTNGFPIFVTEPRSMDRNDNNDIMDMIDEKGKALDASNMIIVVNMADKEGKGELRNIKEKKGNSIVMKRHLRRAYVVSSVMGLGGKKENPKNEAAWMDENHWEIFVKEMEGFSNPNAQVYKRLFEYNILPQDELKRISERVENLEDKELLLWNSGIPCVEEAIGAFAQKYALYNKCAQGIYYLKEAANKVKESVSKAEKEAERLRSESSERLDEKKRSLSKDLEKECGEKVKQFTNRFVDEVMKPPVERYLDTVTIGKIVGTAYINSPGKNIYAKLETFNKEIESKLSTQIRQYSGETSKRAEAYWEKCAEDLRHSLWKMVAESPHLSNEERGILEKVVREIVKVPYIHQNVNIKDTKAVVKKKFLFIFDLTHINLEKAKEIYQESLRGDISKMTLQADNDHRNAFKEWGQQLLNQLNTVIVSFNPHLIKLNQELKKNEEVIALKRKEQEFITKITGKIDQLLEFEEVEE